jgi:DNA-directed RNA polymerase beta subunit
MLSRSACWLVLLEYQIDQSRFGSGIPNRQQAVSKVSRVKSCEVDVDSFVNSKGAIYVSIPSFKDKIPLFILFRAIGVQSDKEICQLILNY